MQHSVKFVENHNGRFLVVSGDQWIRHGIEYVDLIGFELSKFNQLLGLVKTLRPELTDVIDGGSNMGSWTIPLARVHTDLVFHMFEVQRFLYWISCGNLALNHVLNARPHLMGLSECAGEIEVRQPDYTQQANYGSFEVQTPFQNSDCVLAYTHHTDVVPVTNIDSLNLNPCLIKMDVEGMEWWVIQGAIHTIDTHQPLVWAERQKSDPNTVIPFFTERGYSLSFALEGHWLFVPSWLTPHPQLHAILAS